MNQAGSSKLRLKLIMSWVAVVIRTVFGSAAFFALYNF